jgi:hypothetical protein
MNPAAHHLLTELALRGVTVAPEGPYLRLSPRSALTPDLLARVRRLKGQLLALLASSPSPCPTAAPVPLAATAAEWAVLKVLACGPLGRPALLAATRLGGPALDQALAGLVRRGEVARRADGAVRINAC